jgi:Kelch motif/Galactose oxidase, central domain
MQSRAFTWLILTLALCLIAVPARVAAQQRMYASVEPNYGVVTGSVDLYDIARSSFQTLPDAGAAPRSLHTASLLSNGMVLVAGGYDGSFMRSAQLYDPATGFFTATGDPVAARRDHTATLLSSGKVLLAGGYNGSNLNTAELYDPSTGTFVATVGVMISPRSSHSATLVGEKVLLAGGVNGGSLNTAELYDPSSDAFTAANASMTAARVGHTATLLGNGRVLITGGSNGTNFLRTAEIFDPGAGTFTATSGLMVAARSGHTATRLPSGKVLIAGGFNGNYLNTAEIFDPATGTFTAVATQMAAPRLAHTATALADGRVLIAGGESPAYLDTAETYDEASGRFTLAASRMAEPRAGHTATALADGSVMVLGGRNRALLQFDTNLDQTDNISPNILFSADSKLGYVSYTGGGTFVIFSAETGEILSRIFTGGRPVFATFLLDERRAVVVSALDNRVFLIDLVSQTLASTFTFANATFGFGSVITVSPDGGAAYISSTGTGEVVKFSPADGRELGRLRGLQGPAQITLSRDGATLMIVDTLADEVVFADASSLSRRTSLKAKDTEPLADFTIFSKVVLTLEGESGIVASRDNNGTLGSDTAFIFSTATAAVLDVEKVGADPGFTGLTPDGQNWVILSDLNLAVIPITNPTSKRDLPTVQGGVLGSANVVFSRDSRFAYYVSSQNDLAFQHDLQAGAVVGQTVLHDIPSVQFDQPSSVAITPDGKDVAVLDFVSNKIDLLAKKTVLQAAKFISSGDVFTGVSLINLSAETTRFSLLALNNYGEVITGDGVINPREYVFGPNQQISFTVAEIFNFNPAIEYLGRLEISSDRSQVTGYVSIGDARLGFLSFTLERMDGLQLFTNRLYDWIVPEIVRPDGTPVELDVVNPNYNQGTYDLTRIARDGGVLETRTDNTAFPTNRQAQLFTDVFTQPGAGRLLLTGGQTGSTAISASDTYDPSTGSFSVAGAMNTARTAHTMTLLPNGRLLVAGGQAGGTALATAEVYDRETGAFTTTTGSMSVARERPTATLLPSGRVLVTGGRGSGLTYSSAELYDPGSGSFTATNREMVTARFGHTATLLRTGRVLITGGNDGSTESASAELYDPETATFTATGSMNSARAFHTATLMQDGKVLIVGGYNGSYLNTAEVYDPATATFTAVGTMNSLRQDHSATLLPDGRVFIAGGYNGSSLTGCDIYEPSTQGFVAAGAMSTPRREQTATLLPAGLVLIAGGRDGDTALSSAELFDPGNGAFASAGEMTVARSGHAAIFLEAGEDGYLRAVSEAGLIFTEYYGGDRASASLSGIDVSKFSGVTKLSGSLFGLGANSTAVLNLINGNEENAEVRLVLHRADGTVLGDPKTALLFTASQLKADLRSIFGEGTVLDEAAWLEVNSSVDRVVGTLTISDTEENFLTSYELFSTPLTQFIFPMAAADGNFRTGIVLLATDVAANVTLELWGPGGTLDRSATLPLQPGMRMLSYLEDLFPGLDSRVVSNLRVRSDQPIHGISFMTDRDLHFLAAVPAIPFPSENDD